MTKIQVHQRRECERRCEELRVMRWCYCGEWWGDRGETWSLVSCWFISVVLLLVEQCVFREPGISDALFFSACCYFSEDYIWCRDWQWVISISVQEKVLYRAPVYLFILLITYCSLSLLANFDSLGCHRIATFWFLCRRRSECRDEDSNKMIQS